MVATQTRQSFSKRLKTALEKVGIDVRKPSAVAKAFNQRYLGKAVTDYAVRKWLGGDAIPDQDKLVVLAIWLGVSAEWLRYGPVAPSQANQVQQAVAAYEPEELAFFRAYRKLTPEHRLAVREVALALQRVQVKDAKK